jgi:hypothetical protein
MIKLKSPAEWQGIFYVGIALRRRGIMSLKRPAAGGESCKQDSFLYVLTQ